MTPDTASDQAAGTLDLPVSPKILVVDDEPKAVELYEEWLKDRYEVVTAHGGKAAIDKLDDSVDVVLLDRRMPDLSGDEVLEEIRADGYEGGVIMVTAVEPTLDIIWMDFDDYVVKPVLRETLLEMVRRLLIRHAYREPLQTYLQLVSKRRVLESDPTVKDRFGEEYEDLVDRIEVLRPQIETLLSDLSENEVIALGLREFWFDE